MEITERSSVEDVHKWLLSNGISEESSNVLKGNEVDGCGLLHLEEKDLFSMFPHKVGVARKLTTLIKRLNSRSEAVDKIFHIDADGNLINCGVEEPLDTIIVMQEGQAMQGELSSSPTTEMPSSSDLTSSLATSASSVTQSTTTTMTTEKKSIDSYLPKYSAIVQGLLENGNIHNEWERFIEETAYHVLAVGEFNSRGTYEEFGRFMYGKYPCIGHKAMKDQWGFFNKKLSQKVRHIRWKWNVRSKGEGQPKSKKERKSLPSIDLNDEPQMSTEIATKTMQDELQKCSKDQDRALLLKTLRSSFKERRAYIQGLPNSNIDAILKKFPLLGKPYYIEKEYFLMSGQEKKELIGNWEKLLNTLDKLFDDSRESELDIISCMETVSQQIKYQSKGKAMVSLISKCKSSDMVLAGKKSEAPRLVVVTNGDESISTCIVVGDGVSMDVGHDVKEALNILIFTYYALDLTYPKQYQLLGFLQHYLLHDRKNYFFMSTNYLKFSRKVDDELAKL
ncbi:uncharacterized protein LOC134241733 [Saccostrea cucullata]|uniref:uncharacterized protein LOC134241733 n=1 Tax=Saccostrea cuccullata TaxID=36930 RepID=UPI002ED182B1